MLQVNIGIEADTRKEIADGLSRLLAAIQKTPIQLILVLSELSIQPYSVACK